MLRYIVKKAEDAVLCKTHTIMSSICMATHHSKDEALLSMDQSYLKSKELHILQFVKDQKDLQRRLETCRFSESGQAVRRASAHRLRPLTAVPRTSDRDTSRNALVPKNSSKQFDNGDGNVEIRRPGTANDFRRSRSSVAGEEREDVQLAGVDIDTLSVTSIRSTSPIFEDLEDDVDDAQSTIYWPHGNDSMEKKKRQLHSKHDRRPQLVRGSTGARHQTVSSKYNDRDVDNQNGGLKSRKPAISRHMSAPTGLKNEEILEHFGGPRIVNKRTAFSAHQPLPPLHTPCTTNTHGNDSEKA